MQTEDLPAQTQGAEAREDFYTNVSRPMSLEIARQAKKIKDRIFLEAFLDEIEKVCSGDEYPKSCIRQKPVEPMLREVK